MLVARSLPNLYYSGTQDHLLGIAMRIAFSSVRTKVTSSFA